MCVCVYVWSNSPVLFADFVKRNTPVQCFLDLFLDLPAKKIGVLAWISKINFNEMYQSDAFHKISKKCRSVEPKHTLKH